MVYRELLSDGDTVIIGRGNLHRNFSLPIRARYARDDGCLYSRFFWEGMDPISWSKLCRRTKHPPRAHAYGNT